MSQFSPTASPIKGVTTMAGRKRDELGRAEKALAPQVRTMFKAFDSSLARLPDKTGIEVQYLKFKGFDANDPYESKFKRFLNCQDSHSCELPFYKRLLEGWNRSADKENLARDDLIRIVEEAKY